MQKTFHFISVHYSLLSVRKMELNYLGLSLRFEMNDDNYVNIDKIVYRRIFINPSFNHNFKIMWLIQFNWNTLSNETSERKSIAFRFKTNTKFNFSCFFNKMKTKQNWNLNIIRNSITKKYYKYKINNKLKREFPLLFYAKK